MNNHDDDDLRARRLSMLKGLAELVDKLDELIKESNADSEGDATATITTEAHDSEGNVRRTVEQHNASEGLPLLTLTKLLTNLSPEWGVAMARLLLPIREDIVGLVLGQNRAEGILLVTFKLHHDATCDCPEGLNYVTLMHHPRYKESTGEPFAGLLTIGQYETELAALEGHHMWQDKLASMELAELPDVIEGTFNPAENERVVLFRHDVHPTIQ